MSHVTDIILVTSIDDGGIEDAHPNTDLLNMYLERQNKGKLLKIDNYAGGRKAMQCDVFMAAVNHLDMREFIEEFHKISWECKELVQLFLKDEEDDRFAEYIPHEI